MTKTIITIEIEGELESIKNFDFDVNNSGEIKKVFEEILNRGTVSISEISNIHKIERLGTFNEIVGFDYKIKMIG
jgi:hypothetical protein